MDQTSVTGRTRWGRFAVVVLPAGAVLATLATAMVQGVLAATFAVSGVPIQLTSAKVEGTGFNGHLAAVQTFGGSEAAATAGFRTATLDGLCVRATPNFGPLGDWTLKITAGDGVANTQDLRAENLVLDAKSIAGNGEFSGLDLGVAASSARKGPVVPRAGDEGNFGLQADRADVAGMSASALSATIAGRFQLQGLNLGVSQGANPCK